MRSMKFPWRNVEVVVILCSIDLHNHHHTHKSLSLLSGNTVAKDSVLRANYVGGLFWFVVWFLSSGRQKGGRHIYMYTYSYILEEEYILPYLTLIVRVGRSRWSVDLWQGTWFLSKMGLSVRQNQLSRDTLRQAGPEEC